MSGTCVAVQSTLKDSPLIFSRANKNLSTELPGFSLDCYREELIIQTAKTCVSVYNPSLSAIHLNISGMRILSEHLALATENFMVHLHFIYQLVKF